MKYTSEQLKNFTILLASSPIVQIFAVRLLCSKRDRMKLFKLKHITASLYRWDPDEQTEFHTHGEAVGALGVLSGRMKEETLRKDVVLSRVIDADQSSSFDLGVCHRLTCVSQRPAVTLNIYSNDEGGIKEITTFEVNNEGKLLFRDGNPVPVASRRME